MVNTKLAEVVELVSTTTFFLSAGSFVSISDLVFPESAKAGKREKTPPTEGLKFQLVTLDRLVRSFVTNPVFTDAGVINAELAAKARGDLDEIIDLSDKVKKHSAKLNKANASH